MKLRNLFMIGAAGMVAACHGVFAESRDPGEHGERMEAIGDFERLSVGGAYDVVVRTGSKASLKMEGPENILAEIEIEQDGDRLQIGQKHGNWNWGKHDGVDITITVPMLREAGLSGASNIAIDRIKTDSFKGRISGAGNMKIGSLEADDIDFGISGAGDVETRGSGSNLKARISGAGSLNAPDLVVSTADVRVSGAGSVKAQVTDSATARASGAGNVTLTGGADCDARESGAGSVSCS